MEFLYGFSDCWALSRSCKVDWEAWASVATALALILAGFALAFESRRASKMQRGEWARADRLLNAQLSREEAARHATATRLALVIDHELFVLGGSMSALSAEFTDDTVASMAGALLQMVEEELANDHLRMTQLFMPELGVFDADVGARITIVIRSLHSFGPPMPAHPDHLPPEVLRSLAAARRAQFSKLLGSVRQARSMLRPYLDRYHKAPLDFDQVRAAVLQDLHESGAVAERSAAREGGGNAGG